MRQLIVPAIAVAFLATAPLALASQTTQGTVRHLDARAMTLSLSDGHIYHLPKGWSDPGIKAGDKVAISYGIKDSHRVAESVTAQTQKPAAKPAG